MVKVRPRAHWAKAANGVSIEHEVRVVEEWDGQIKVAVSEQRRNGDLYNTMWTRWNRKREHDERTYSQSPPHISPSHSYSTDPGPAVLAARRVV